MQKNIFTPKPSQIAHDVYTKHYSLGDLSQGDIASMF